MDTLHTGSPMLNYRNRVQDRLLGAWRTGRVAWCGANCVQHHLLGVWRTGRVAWCGDRR
jgi:hypothetical protein